MKILFVNSRTKNCGVYQFGKRISKILSPRLDSFLYYEVSNLDEFYQIRDNYDITIFNYIAAGRSSGPLGWLNQQILQGLKDAGVIVGVIGHLNNVRFDFDFILSQDPNDQFGSENLYSIFRPLPLDMSSNPYIKGELESDFLKREIPKIGSFGFAAKSKGFDALIGIVNEEFSEAEIRLHITSADYSDPTGERKNSLINQCKSVERKSSIKLNITSGFVDDDDILSFLSKNDLNVFNYENSDDGGISSVIDFAISSNTPFAVSRSKMFRHVFENCYFIDKGLANALHDQSNVNQFFMKKWSHEAFTDRFLSIMKTVVNKT
jgi:hypothetical protein